MKKVLSTILVLVLLLLLIQSTALAETGYVYIKTIISDTIGNGFSRTIQDAQSAKSLKTSTTVTLMVEPWEEENNMMLVGRNSTNQPESTLWTASPVELYAILGTFCTEWRATSMVLDSGYSLVIVYYDENDDPTIISTEEQADLLAQAFITPDATVTPVSPSSGPYALGFSFVEFKDVFDNATADMITSRDIQSSGESSWLYSFSSNGTPDFEGGAIIYRSANQRKDDGCFIEVLVTYDNSSDQFGQWAAGIHGADDLFTTDQYNGFIDITRRFIQILAPGTTDETAYQVLADAIQKTVAENYKYVNFTLGEGTGYPRTGDFEFQFTRGGNWMELDARRYQEGASPLGLADANPTVTATVAHTQVPTPEPTAMPTSTPEITVNPDVAANFLYASNGTEIRINAYIGNGGDVVIPDEIGGIPVTRLADKAFYDNSESVRGITLSNNLIAIGEYIFGFCYLTGVLTMPETVQEIGSGAFSFTDLTGLIIQSDCSISRDAFSDCDEMEFVYIKEGCSPQIGFRVFEDDKALKIAVIPASVTHIEDSAFDGCNYLTIITTPGSYAEDYARRNFIAYETDTYDEYVEQYEKYIAQ